MLDLILRAGETAGNAGNGNGMTGEEMAGTAAGSLMSVGLLVLMFVVFYFILIRPQRKREKELKEEVSKLSVGDRVVTIGGLVGFVANIKDNEITISTSAANTLVTFTKNAIQTVVKRENLNPDGSIKKVDEPEKTSLFGKKKEKKSKDED